MSNDVSEKSFFTGIRAESQEEAVAEYVRIYRSELEPGDRIHSRRTSFWCPAWSTVEVTAEMLKDEACDDG